jgi:CRISPR-associated endonuclease Cas2
MAEVKEKIVVKGLTKAILIGIGAGAIIGAACTFPAAGFLYNEFKKKQWEDIKKRGSLKATIKRLEKQQLLSWREVDGQVILTLTENGKKKVLRYQLESMKLPKLKKWDNLWRVIIFDIPEEKKTARELFRKKLKDLGFYQLQKSVFISRIECKNEIDFLRHTFEISQYVTYILAKEISSIALKKQHNLL